MSKQQVNHMLNLLEGGGIYRYHTKNCIDRQTVQSHSWRMAAMLHTLWPACRQTLLWAVLMHDVSERITGDIPYTVKSNNPGLRMELKRITYEEEVRLGVRYDLMKEEQQVLAFLDLYEGAMYCLDEIEMGNRKLQATFGRYITLAQSTPLDDVYIDRKRTIADMIDFAVAKGLALMPEAE